MPILLGVLVIIAFVVIRILRAIFTRPDEKQDSPSPIQAPQRRRPRHKPSQTEPAKLPQESSPIQPEIREKGDPYFSKRPPEIPKHVPQPFDYHAAWWKKYSTWYRNEKAWTCEICQISLNDNRYYLHTYHIWGTQHNDPNDLQALCIACHTEQPGSGHQRFRAEQDYHDFMRKYGKQWRFRRYN